MINRIWGLKQLWLRTWDPLSCSEQTGIEKFKKKIYVSSGIWTHATLGPVKQRFRPLGNAG